MSPKLFISYSQTNPDYSERVRKLADTLISDGVEVVLDQYDLREGQEANEFMERMVTSADIRKVGLFCDPTYVMKANGRLGGVGTETQIVSAELYRQTGEGKFVAIILERPEDPEARPVPAFYTSRIYIDLSAEEFYHEQYERLLRWVFDKPLNVKPQAGQPPAFLDLGSATTSSTQSRQRRALEALRQGRSNSAALVDEYLDAAVKAMEGFRLPPNEPVESVQIRQRIADFLPLRDEILPIVEATARHLPDDESGPVLHSFLEKTLPLRERPEGVNAWRESNFENIRFCCAELYLHSVSALLNAQKYQACQHLFEPYYRRSETDRDPMVPPTAFHAGDTPHLREGHERQISPAADLLKTRCSERQFRDIMQADLLLHLRSETHDFWWFPFTLIYSDRWTPFEVFARAESKRWLDKILRVIGVPDLDGLRRIVEGSQINRTSMFFNAGGISLGRQTNLEKLGTRP